MRGTRSDAASRMMGEMEEEEEPEEMDIEGTADEASEERSKMHIEMTPQDAQGVKNIAGLFRKGK